MSGPYYADDTVTLWCGDNGPLLAATTDRSVDCVITDPPFSERTHAMARSNAAGAHRPLAGATAKFDAWDTSRLATTFAQLGRITRGWVIASLDYRHAVHFEETPPAGLRVLRIGVWVKTNPMPMLSGDRPGQGWEAFVFMHREDTKPAWYGGGRSANWVGPTVQNSGHPTSKPVGLIASWLHLFTKPGDLVLDPFAGSGSTLRAAADTSRRAHGIELDPKYCDLIVTRLAQGALDLGGVA